MPPSYKSAMRIIASQSAYLLSGLLHEVYPPVELSKFVMARRGVGEDLHSIQTHLNVGPVIRPASYTINPTHEAGVNSSSQSSTPMTVSSVATTASPKGTVVYRSASRSTHEGLGAHLSCDLPDHTRKRMFLGLTMLHPGCEMP